MSEKQTFASHIKAKFWSAKNTGLPADYALNSHKKCWFDCDCGHAFERVLHLLTFQTPFSQIKKKLK
jgi:hypothetical protein